MCEVSEVKAKLSKPLEQLISEKEILGQTVHEQDLRTCDLLHIIEISKSKGLKNFYQNCLIVKEIRKVRKTRRLAKDQIEILNILIHYKQKEKIDFNRIVNRINWKKASFKTRHYNPRMDGKLTKII